MTKSSSFIRAGIVALVAALVLCVAQVAPAFAGGIHTPDTSRLDASGTSSSSEVKIGAFVVDTSVFPRGTEYSVEDGKHSWVMTVDGQRVLLMAVGYTDLDFDFDSYSFELNEALVSGLAESLFEEGDVTEMITHSLINSNGIPWAMSVGTSSSLDIHYIIFTKGSDLLTVVLADTGSSAAFAAAGGFAFDFLDAVSYAGAGRSSSSTGSTARSSSSSGSSGSSSSSSSSSSSTQTYTIGAGVYIVGDDIAAGRYDIVAVSGHGNIASWNASGRLGINEIMGVDDGYLETYKGLRLESGGELEISGSLIVTLTPR